MRIQLLYPSVIVGLSIVAVLPAAGCSEDKPDNSQSTGTQTGGAGFGGNTTGGVPTGGVVGTGGTTGGVIGTGGTTGGVGATGGTTSSGGTATGGSSSGSGGGGAAGGGAGGGAGKPSGGMAGGGTAGASTAGGGGSGGGGDVDEIPATFQTVKDIIQSNEGACLGVACHTDPNNPLDLRINDGLYMRLTTVVSKACMNRPIVNPGKASESALVMMLKGPCGATPRMPYDCKDATGSCLPTAYVDAIEKWINNGAPQN